jgi:hypothetical protein
LQWDIYAFFNERRGIVRRLCLFAVVISITLAFFPAYAMTDLEYWVADHNLHCYTTSAKEISGVYKIDNDVKGLTQYIYNVSDYVRYGFIEKDGSIVSFCCACLDESETAEFLSQCVTGCLSFCGIDNGINCYDPILYSFTSARAGHETDYYTNIPGASLKLSKTDYGYFFILMKENER